MEYQMLAGYTIDRDETTTRGEKASGTGKDAERGYASLANPTTLFGLQAWLEEESHDVRQFMRPTTVPHVIDASLLPVGSLGQQIHNPSLGQGFPIPSRCRHGSLV